MRIRDLVRRHQHRAGRREGIKGLADHPLFAILLELPVAGRHVMPDDIAGDVIGRRARRDILAPLADDDDQLGLEIDLLADRGQDDGVAMADERGGVLAEEDRVLRDGSPALGRVVPIIEADADDLARIVNGRMILDLMRPRT